MRRRGNCPLWGNRRLAYGHSYVAFAFHRFLIKSQRIPDVGTRGEERRLFVGSLELVQDCDMLWVAF
jgi:hypothetical protein